MPLQKQGINISFGQGIETKMDPKQVPVSKLLALSNVVFNNSGALTKRNGFQQLTSLPAGSTASSICTYNGGLLAVGSNLYSYASETNSWVNQGKLPAVNLQVTELSRTNLSKTNCDMAISPAGLVCTTYQDSNGSYYKVLGLGGETVVAETALPSTATLPRVFCLNSYFVVTYLATVSATPHLQYIALPIGNPGNPSAAADISTSVKSLSGDYDGVVANGQLYLTWNGSDGGGAVRITFMTNQLVVSTPVILAGSVADKIAITADNQTNSALAIAFYTSSSTTTYTAVYSANLVQVLAPTSTFTSTTVPHLTVTANDSVARVYVETQNTYTYDSSIKTNYIQYKTISYAGSVSSATTVLRSVGLASKALTIDGSDYMLAVYGDPSFTSQPSYFFVDSSGNVICKVAYSNGSGFLTTSVLSKIQSYDGSYYVGYLFKDQVVAVNKTQGLTGIVNGVFGQLGVNLAELTFSNQQYTAEIASNLFITGGLLWSFDGSNPVEQGFNLWPENCEKSATATTGGTMAALLYYYQFTYEWTDARGNLIRSAPSLPVTADISASGTATNTVTLKVPTLRITNKSQVRIVGYRWSTAQQAFYQFTSISSPTLNDKSVDFVTITDTLADAGILGNPLLYTTGGVLENIGAPAAAAVTLFKNRLWLLDAEDRNLLWYSQPVLEATPVEMTDLLTLYVAPTIGSQGSTGDITAISSMDDKLIVFKRDAIYYVTGNGPDSTGANNDLSEPVFISSAAGCTNQNSIVFTPQGLIFQSDKGLWLLGRDLGTTYIGSPVQAYNDATVESALSIPGTNQVRFTLDSGITLMYDYFEQQWGTFTNIPAISSTLFESLHAYLDSSSRIFQETPDQYLDGSSPVLMSLTTAWIKFDLQTFQRAYFFYILGTFLSPHKLNVEIAYDYDPSTQQTVLVTPTNTVSTWGSDQLWGSSTPWGGDTSVEQARVLLAKQKCQSIQVTITEVFDSSYGTVAGAGLVLSGLNMVLGSKKGYPSLKAAKSYG